MLEVRNRIYKYPVEYVKELRSMSREERDKYITENNITKIFEGNHCHVNFLELVNLNDLSVVYTASDILDMNEFLSDFQGDDMDGDHYYIFLDNTVWVDEIEEQKPVLEATWK